MADAQCESSSETLAFRCILDANYTSNLKDQYVLGKQLGWGQFGVIRMCSDKLTGEVLACKSIAKDKLVSSNDVQSVKLEIDIMTKLSGHPYVVDLKAVFEEEDYVHLVMELCAGGELFHQLEKQGQFSESEAKVLFRHLIQVVSYCHKNGVVHRDLKPENILLATKGSSSPIKLADFGLATYINPGQSLHGLVGSPFYIAPEVLAGAYNQAADVWSAGVILYILLSGMPPFWGKTKSKIFEAVRAANLKFPSDHWNDISEAAKDLIRGMLSTDPLKRLTAEQVLDHSWMKDNKLYLEQSSRHGNLSCGDNVGSNSFSNSLISRCQDLSFTPGSPVESEPESPTFSCRSSFSSFLMEPSTPGLPSCGFTFSESSDSNGLVFSSPVPSLPSFAFFSPTSVEQDISRVEFGAIPRFDAIHGDARIGRLLTLVDSSTCVGSEAEERKHKQADIKRVAGTTTGFRIPDIHNKRNRTIGLGEHEELSLIVTESIIRWSSCTQLPTSLRSSLVC